jgi:plasmid maintenance system antidote protein VapI
MDKFFSSRFLLPARITMKNPSKEISIGERIRQVFDKSDMSITQFAESLHCDRANIYNIFRRKKIDIYLLSKISKILNHDFVEELCTQYGVTKGIPSSKIFLTLEINSMEHKMLNKLLKTVKQLEIKAVKSGV